MQATEIPVLIFDFINISLNREKKNPKTPAVVHSSSPNLIVPAFFFYRYSLSSSQVSLSLKLQFHSHECVYLFYLITKQYEFGPDQGAYDLISLKLATAYSMELKQVLY